ncbi:hypothetical protein [Kitasatospora purpeofusca]|uniref:hypothetical protein n=1 Tax=Kitasatospora purpeofusca TaxID=67352 RepID=UPI000A6C3BE4|nr:hypothetical protein [Kitasatospora purpeofusca]MCX4755998.1 hypothetical protein [Kitasatospora purpeofusca]WSR36157.1 hypothetical protein OG715_37540 [Kitasatospora purpeofusca]WSR44443.1 hypothetical protein OG196_38400 [Kitasatospora purpeofusca]
MNARIAALTVAAAGIMAATIAPASAATANAGGTTPVTNGAGGISCTTVLNQPCVWQEKDGGGFVGVAQVSADPGQLTIVKVEVRTQRAWGSPWLTTASATTVTKGSARAVTPRVVTSDLKMVCATAGPALEAGQQVTTCTYPF